MKKIFILILLIFCVCLIACKKTNSIGKINKSIDNLDDISDDSNRMLEIMKIKREIKGLNTEDLYSIDLTKLNNINEKTLKNLTTSFSWQDIYEEDNYYTLDSIFKDNKINAIHMIDSTDSNKLVTKDSDFIESFFEIIDVPYLNIIEESDSFKETYTEKVYGVNTHYKFNIVIENAYGFLYLIDILDNGYLIIRFGVKIEGIINELVIREKKISLMSIDFASFKKFIEKRNIKKYKLDYYIDEVKNKSEEELIKTAKQDFLNFGIKCYREAATIEDVILREYLGVYNNSIVGVFIDRDFSYSIENPIKCDVAGYDFNHVKGHGLSVYHKGSFYPLKYAFDDGLIGLDDLEIIYKKYRNIE